MVSTFLAFHLNRLSSGRSIIPDCSGFFSKLFSRLWITEQDSPKWFVYCCPHVATNTLPLLLGQPLLQSWFKSTFKLLLDSCINSTTLLFADQMTWAGCSCPNTSTHPFWSAPGQHPDTDILIQHQVQRPLELLEQRCKLYLSRGARTPPCRFKDSTLETTHTSDGCNLSDFFSHTLSFPLSHFLLLNVTIYFLNSLTPLKSTAAAQSWVAEQFKAEGSEVKVTTGNCSAALADLAEIYYCKRNNNNSKGQKSSDKHSALKNCCVFPCSYCFCLHAYI